MESLKYNSFNTPPNSHEIATKQMPAATIYTMRFTQMARIWAVTLEYMNFELMPRKYDWIQMRAGIHKYHKIFYWNGCVYQPTDRPNIHAKYYIFEPKMNGTEQIKMTQIVKSFTLRPQIAYMHLLVMSNVIV